MLEDHPCDQVGCSCSLPIGLGAAGNPFHGVCASSRLAHGFQIPSKEAASAANSITAAQNSSTNQYKIVAKRHGLLDVWVELGHIHSLRPKIPCCRSSAWTVQAYYPATKVFCIIRHMGPMCSMQDYCSSAVCVSCANMSFHGQC